MNYVKNSASLRRRSRRSRGVKRRIVAFAALFAIVALATWSVLRLRAGNPSPSAVAVPPALTVAARTPAPQWSVADQARLGAQLRDAFAPALDGADRWSIAVLDGDGRQLYGDRSDRAVTPASVLKLLVAATALDALGAHFRYTTMFAGTKAIDDAGTLGGNLWLVGSGDPSLRTNDLRAGVSSLAVRGLRRIDGGVVVDATSLGGPEINPHWDPDDANEDFQAAVSAMSLDGDTIEFDVTGTTSGSPADVRIEPPSDDVSTTGTIDTAADDSVVINPTSPNAFELSGDVPEGVTEKFWVPVHGIPRYTGAVLARMLGDANVETAAPPSVGPAPLASIVLWDHRSAPLRVLENHMLFHSDNHYAEQLLRTVGRELGPAPDDAGGIAVERQFLSERGIPAPGLHVVDGSGLAADDRIAAATLAGILADAQARGGDASLYLLLPQGGRQGTLRYYDFTTALGRVRAKSGHIGGVASLAGYVNTVRHGRVVFAFMINGSPGSPDDAIVRAVDRLADF
jgi:serine-type D-Ala-D-Ala carboxypeptidase/endopeptidase (penicillin-binding protein 4)